MSLSEFPERVARLESPRPLEGSSRRRCPGAVEESLLEEAVLSERCGAVASRSVSLIHRAPSGVAEHLARRSQRCKMPSTKPSHKGARSWVASWKAKRRQVLPPWIKVKAAFTVEASSLMGRRRSEGKCLFLNINLDKRRFK